MKCIKCGNSKFELDTSTGKTFHVCTICRFINNFELKASSIEEIKEQFETWEDELCPTEIVRHLLSIIEKDEKFKVAAKALDDIMNIELTQDGETMYMNILEIRNIVGVVRMKIKKL